MVYIIILWLELAWVLIIGYNLQQHMETYKQFLKLAIPRFWSSWDFLFLCISNYIFEPAQKEKVCPLSSCQSNSYLMAAVIWQELSDEACTQGNHFLLGVPEQMQWCVCVWVVVCDILPWGCHT